MAMANKAIDKTEEFFTSINLPNSLKALGIGEEHIDEMAQHAFDFNGAFHLCPRPLDVEDIKQIYRNCLK